MIDKAREVALKILYDIDKENAYSNIALDKYLNSYRQSLNDKDIGLISEIVYGTTTWKLTIDEMIKKYSNIKIKKISFWILNILRMGVYQIVFLDKIPKSAAVNEAVNLAKRYGHKSSSNFVNAILRKIDRKDYEDMFLIKDDIERISKTTSMPIWLVEELLKELSIEEVQLICESFTKKPNMTVRFNLLKTNQQDFTQKLQERHINFTKANLEEFMFLSKTKGIETMDIFEQGFFTIQDEAAGLAAKILQVQPNDKVLDACSAPGGKTTFLAELMNNTGEILAWDIHLHRTTLVEKAAKRLGITNIRAQVKDASKFDSTYENVFDKILLDVPCLGIGVIKRKPDIKWQRTKEDIYEITKIQMSILENCSKYLKKGGELVYSTCSILKEENEDIIETFLKEHSDFQISKLNLKYEIYKRYYKKDAFLKLFPNENHDGFFICKLKKL